jgi:two-component sensor histidine kinase
VFSSASDALFLLDARSEAINECNASAAKMFECVDASELVGLRPENLRKTRWSEAENKTIREALAGGGPWTQELEFQTVRGRRFWGQMAIVSLGQSAEGTRLLRVSDISGLKHAEEQLRSSLADKEVLLKEVYHRVKNNLQIISALLRLQARRVTDDGALEAIEKSINRVMAMSMVHEKLYQAQNLASIDFLQFAEGLVGFLNQLTEEETSDAVVRVSGTSLSLSIDQAIPLGLVLNELVTNAIKYAYAEGERGVINVSVGGGSGAPATIVVEDRGRGLPENESGEAPTGLGFRIVKMLVEQLHGELDIRSHAGLRVTVTVPEHHE